MSEKIRVHIGAGKRDFGEGWYNVDAVEFPHIHSKDISLSEFKDDSVSLVYASHFIEYFSLEEITPLLKQWHRVLKSDGIIRLAVPDFDSMAHLYNDKRFELDSFLGPLFGKMEGGNGNLIYHRCCYDFTLLNEILTEAGFHEAHRYNWRKTEHRQFDDCASAYLPKMQKDDGVLISLNVQATKSPVGFIKHWMAGTKTYQAWSNMIARCTNPNDISYPIYGARGIKIEDERWKQFHHFFNDMGECPKWGSIDRINNDLGYSKNNCKWSDKFQQAFNRRTTIRVEHNGEIKSVNEWARILKIPRATLLKRVNAGYSIADAFNKSENYKYRMITFNNETKSLSDWAKSIGISIPALSFRLENEWPLEKALTAPKGSRKKDAVS